MVLLEKKKYMLVFISISFIILLFSSQTYATEASNVIDNYLNKHSTFFIFYLILVTFLIFIYFYNIKDTLYVPKGKERIKIDKKRNLIVAPIFQLFIPFMGMGYVYLKNLKRLIIWWSIFIFNGFFIKNIIGNSNYGLVITVIWIITIIDCYYLSIKYEEKKYEDRIKLEKQEEMKKLKKTEQKKERIKRTQEKQRLEKEREVIRKKELEAFEKSQIEKGFKKYKGEWLKEFEYKKETAIDAFLNKCKHENRYKGLFMGCKSCGFVWKIRKDYSLPIRCTACGSDNIKLDREKINSDII